MKSLHNGHTSDSIEQEYIKAREHSYMHKIWYAFWDFGNYIILLSWQRNISFAVGSVSERKGFNPDMMYKVS